MSVLRATLYSHYGFFASCEVEKSPAITAK